MILFLNEQQRQPKTGGAGQHAGYALFGEKTAADEENQAKFEADVGEYRECDCGDRLYCFQFAQFVQAQAGERNGVDIG